MTYEGGFLMGLKFLKSLLTTLIIATVFFVPIPVQADQPIQVFINGQQLAMNVSPVIKNGRTLVPLRAIFEALGVEVSWDDNTRTVTE